jgi:hypothetical protein
VCGGFVSVSSRTGKVSSIQSLPLFPTEDEIATVVLGVGCAPEWKAIAPLLEARGLPKIDTLMGGRYMPAVVAFFDHLYGLDQQRGEAPLAPDGVEDFGKWNQRQKRHS